jgi:hypothetical protein
MIGHINSFLKERAANFGLPDEVPKMEALVVANAVSS